MLPLALVALVLLPPAPDDPAAFVDQWHAAMKEGRRDAMLAAMAADATVFEAGGAEMGRDAYAVEHLDADIAFARATTTRVEKRDVVDLGPDAVLVLSQTAASGTFEGKAVSSAGVETMALRRDGGTW